MKPAQSPSCEHPLVSLIAGDQPISFTVVAVIADSRKSARVAEVRRKLSFVATPESLASLPGNLNALVRGVGSDAQVALSKFLERLAQPEPPAPVASTRPEESGQATVAPMETELATPEPASTTGSEHVPQEYLPVVDMLLLGPLP